MSSLDFVRPLLFQPGIQRDGTEFHSKSFIDGQWTRFYGDDALPRKIGGYQYVKNVSNDVIIRSMYGVPKQTSTFRNQDVYLGRYNNLSFFNINLNNITSTLTDRTPVDLVSDPLNMWQFDTMGVSPSGVKDTLIFAQVAPILDDVSAIEEGPLYYGSIYDTAPLTQLPDPQSCSGGVCVVAPFVFIYGNDGIIHWCAAGDPSTWPDENILIIGGTKVVQGLPTRSGGNPSAIFWTLNSVVRVSYDPSIDSFTQNTIQQGTSIIGTNSVVKYDDTFYWIGVDQFYQYNGVVQKLRNNFNKDYFFNNVNFAQSQKIWGMAIPSWNEIWWFWPSKGSTENNNVLIYNVLFDCWYDSIIDRTCGISPNVYPFPMMCGSRTLIDPSIPVIDNQPYRVYPVWIHEIGYDKVIYDQHYAIQSYYETPILDIFGSGQMNLQTRTRRIEPDFVMTEHMDVRVKNRAFPQSSPKISSPKTITSTTDKIDFSQMGRLVSLVFNSNTVGGFYQQGKILSDLNVGDPRPGS